MAATQSDDPLQSKAELTNFEETSSYNEVRLFFEKLSARTPRVRLESFGRTEEGRDLPLVIVGEPPPASPQAAHQGGRPVVLVMANIHAGEVEGKEAVQHLTRRLTTGDLQPLLKASALLIVPIYNADGNEKVSVQNRTEQNGPVAGVGTRENAKGLDLNRDFMKLDSAEARALVTLINQWNPHVIVDLHTTNGSYHGYHLTYAPTLNPDADPKILAYAREKLLPAVQRAVRERHRFRIFDYGNFATEESLGREVNRFEGLNGTRVWRTFDHRPRFGNNYVGLRNQIAILSEAYSYLDFRGRVAVTEAFVEEILRFIGANGREIVTLTAEAARTIPSLRGSELGVRASLAATPGLVEILEGAVEKKLNPRSGREMVAMKEDVATPVPMRHYGHFEPAQRTKVPYAYALRLPANDPVRGRVLSNLRTHGIRLDELASEARVEVSQLMVSDIRRAERAFQGHNEVTLEGRNETSTIELPAGTVVVPVDQPLGRLVFYLLDPESDDGLTTWNVFDQVLKTGAPHPVARLMTDSKLPLRTRP